MRKICLTRLIVPKIVSTFDAFFEACWLVFRMGHGVLEASFDPVVIHHKRGSILFTVFFPLGSLSSPLPLDLLGNTEQNPMQCKKGNNFAPFPGNGDGK